MKYHVVCRHQTSNAAAPRTGALPPRIVQLSSVTIPVRPAMRVALDRRRALVATPSRARARAVRLAVTWPRMPPPAAGASTTGDRARRRHRSRG
jgi:hypothetical protein